MSATSKTKKVAFDSFKLVQKQDTNKRERINVNMNLRNISRNPSLANSDDDIDDTPFFNFEEE